MYRQNGHAFLFVGDAAFCWRCSFLPLCRGGYSDEHHRACASMSEAVAWNREQVLLQSSTFWFGRQGYRRLDRGQALGTSIGMLEWELLFNLFVRSISNHRLEFVCPGGLPAAQLIYFQRKPISNRMRIIITWRNQHQNSLILGKVSILPYLLTYAYRTNS